MAAILDEQRLMVKVFGGFACFTRPDLKVERMSYPCMTPAAARGILDSILWKPEFKWYVRRILVLKPVSYFSVKRNELNSKQGSIPFDIEAMERVSGSYKARYRAQRTSVILRDVAYIIEASIFQDNFDTKNPPVKYVEMFRRRVRKGQCFRRPYLGTREFSCDFEEPTPGDVPISDTIPIGSLFYDMFYTKDGVLEPLFAYNTAVRNGILDCDNARGSNGLLNEKLMTSSHFRAPVSGGVKELLQFYSEQEAQEVGHAE